MYRKDDLRSLKSDVAKLDIHKLKKNILSDLNKLDNVLEIDYVKITVYDILLKKVNTNDAIDTSKLFM